MIADKVMLSCRAFASFLKSAMSHNQLNTLVHRNCYIVKNELYKWPEIRTFFKVQKGLRHQAACILTETLTVLVTKTKPYCVRVCKCNIDTTSL